MGPDTHLPAVTAQRQLLLADTLRAEAPVLTPEAGKQARLWVLSAVVFLKFFINVFHVDISSHAPAVVFLD